LEEGALHFPIVKLPQKPEGSPKLANSTAVIFFWSGHVIKASGVRFSPISSFWLLLANDLILGG